jgi:hypothetical protein
MIRTRFVTRRRGRLRKPGEPRIRGAAALALAWASVASGGVVACQPETEAPQLGPADGQGLPPTEIERVAVGDPAPDFTLVTLVGDTLTLSDFRGKKDVILVFYRGHW